MLLINEDETLDELDSYKIIQKKNGYRFSADSVQLADFILPLKSYDSVIDLGTGSGVIPLILAGKSPVLDIVGIEIQEDLAEIAKRNVEVNGLSSRIRIIKEDFREIGRGLREAFSVVVSNPPYTKASSGRISPFKERAMARMDFACPLNCLVKTSVCLLAENGRIYYVYPVSRLEEMLSCFKDNGLKVKRLEFIYAGRARRFLLEAVRI